MNSQPNVKSQPNPVWVGFFGEARRLAAVAQGRLLAALPTNFFQARSHEEVEVFCDNFEGDTLAWLNFDPAQAGGYTREYHALTET